VPAGAISTTSAARAWATTEHVLSRPYVVLDTGGLQRALDCSGAELVQGRVERADAHTVTLADGRVVRAEAVIDARGSRPHPDRAQQTAFGLVLPRTRAAFLEQTWFMDWRRDNGTQAGDPPSFLYVVPLDDEHVLVEETCLVGRPALGATELRRRLLVRLAARGIALSGDEREERVRFSVEPEPDPDPVGAAVPLRIGARGGLMHPATGYSVALSLAVAQSLTDAIAGGARTQAELSALLWPRAERTVRGLRSIGLRTLLRLPPAGVPEFFEAFFRLPPGLQRTYLSQRDRPTATLVAMAAMAAGMRPALSRIAVGTALTRDRRVTGALPFSP
jgi:lycopene beta-cyclase